SVTGCIGVVLGVLFPSGIRFVERDRGLPLALGINGATSVVGSILSMIVSVIWGIGTSFVVAAAFYVVAALCGPHRWERAYSGRMICRRLLAIAFVACGGASSSQTNLATLPSATATPVEPVVQKRGPSDALLGAFAIDNPELVAWIDVAGLAHTKAFATLF